MYLLAKYCFLVYVVPAGGAANVVVRDERL